MAIANASYMGLGPVYMRDLSDSDGGLIAIGNCSKLNFTVDSETKKQKDYTQSGGGTVARVDRINTVGCNMTWLDLSAENLAKALNGTATSVVSGTVSTTPEEIVAILDSLVRLAHPNRTSVVVKNSAGSTTYVSGTDYTVSAGGITPLSTGSITASEALKVTYSYGAYSVIQALGEAAKDYALFFEGLNDVSGNPVLIDAWKVRFGPGKDIAWIGDDFAELAVEGEILKDSTKGTGVSAYYRVQMAA